MGVPVAMAGDDEGATRAKVELSLAKVLKCVVVAHSELLPPHQVVTIVEVTNAVVVRRVLLCLGLKTGAAFELPAL